MGPIDFAVHNPVKISVGVILLLMFGLLSLTAIPIQLIPTVDKPVVSVTTRWDGASPQEIENDVVREQEDALKSIPGLERMIASCQQGEGQIVLEFPVGADKDAALREVSEKLRQVPEYPPEVDEPVVEDSDPDNRDYIAWIIFQTDDKSFDMRHLQKWAEDNVKAELERVEGVSEVNVLGGAEPEVHIRVDPVRLADYRIPVGRVETILREQNVNTSAGDVEEAKLNVRLRAVGRFESVDQIRQLIISRPDEPVVRISDVAEVVETYEEPTAIVRSRGEVVLAINAQRSPGSNVMEVMTEYRQRIAFINENILPAKTQELGLTAPLRLVQVYDQTIYIDQAIGLVQSNLFIGGVLAVMVLLLFLRSIRSTIIVALAIPISVIGTFFVLVAFDRNINVISLAGLSFAVGMVVDNAIVVLENIDRHLRMGKKPFAAALEATREVWGAILASTLTTLAVFIPVIFVQEEAGQLFRDIAIAIVAAVTLSLLVSALVIPVASSRFLKQRKEKTAAPAGKRRANKAIGGVDKLYGAIVDGITHSVAYFTKGWAFRPIIIIVLAGASLVFSYLLMPPASYLPSGNRNLIFGLLIPPPGYNLDQMTAIGQRVEGVVSPYYKAEPGSEAAANLPPVPVAFSEDGQPVMAPCPPLSNFFFVGLERGIMFSGAISSDANNVDPVAGLLNSAFRQPGLFGFAVKQPLIRTGRSTAGIELEISGPDYDAVKRAAGAVFGQVMGRQWRATPTPGNFNLPNEEVRVNIDLVKANDNGLRNTDIGLITQMLGDGAVVGDFIQGGDTIDTKLISSMPHPDGAMYVRDVPIASEAGKVVPLGDVSNVVRSTGPQQLNRIERQRAIRIDIELPADLALEDAMAIINNEMIQPLRESGVIDPTTKTYLSGSAAKLGQVKRALLGEWTGFNSDSLYSLVTSRMFLALFVVFLLMAALFENWLYPLVIMFSVPLATVGGFLGLRLVHEFNSEQQLDVLTMLGFVILVGVVVNNAILIVHQALNFARGAEGEKMPPRDAIRESVRTRIRPIFMSTLTSVGGMMPLVLFPGAGSELYRGLGSVVVGGLLVSTVFTLLLVPLVLSVVFDLRPPVAQTD